MHFFFPLLSGGRDRTAKMMLRSPVVFAVVVCGGSSTVDVAAAVSLAAAPASGACATGGLLHSVIDQWPPCFCCRIFSHLFIFCV